MKLYDAITMTARFNRYVLEKYHDGTRERKMVRAKWDVMLNIYTSVGAKTSCRTMNVEFNTGLPEMYVTGFFPSFRTTTKKGKRVIDPKDKYWAESELRSALAAGKNENSSDVLRAIRPPEPDKSNVLYCLTCDANGLDGSMGFEDWADNFGYDRDSRKAEQTYHACVKQTNEFREFLGGRKNLEQLSTFVRMIDEMTEPAARAAWTAEAVAKEINADTVSIKERHAKLYEEADTALRHAAKVVLDNCPRFAHGCAAMGRVFFVDTDGMVVDHDDGKTPVEKGFLDIFYGHVSDFHELFGPSYGPWKILRDGSIITDW